MNTAYQLLRLTPDIINNFALQANLVVDGQMQRSLEKRIRELSRIEERFAEGTESVASKESVDKIIAKVKRLSLNSYVADKEWSFFELRILSYNLGQISYAATVFDYAVNLLDRNWRNLFINGLLFYLLNDWLSPLQIQKSKVCTILKRKLEAYNGDNQRYKSIKNHANFLDSNGPFQMATLLVHKSMPVISAPTILGYKESALSFSYFSDVILNFFDLSGAIEIPVLEQVFACHQLDRTKKLVLARMVEQAEKDGRESLQTKVSKFAQAILGDIALSSTWAPFPNATQEEIKRLRKSQLLVNQWNARKAINTFFELCVQDYSRKEFWLKYTPFIYDFRIVGSKAIRTKLRADDRLTDILSEYYVMTNSEYGQTSALIIYIQDKVFVEFSDTGALYVYDQSHSKVSTLRNKRRLSAIESLKMPSIQKLVDDFIENAYVRVPDNNNPWGYTYVCKSTGTFNDEGKMIHVGYWQTRLHAWMLNRLEIDFTKPEQRGLLYDHNNYLGTLESSTSEQAKNEKPQPVAKSKLLFGDLCRVEAYSDGLYLYICQNGKLAKLVDKKWEPNGNIWIKKDKDYEKIYYHTSGKDEYLGFLTFWNFSQKEIRFYPLYHDKIIVPIN